MTVLLSYVFKARARREIERAAAWWSVNRLAAPGAIRRDLEYALALLVEQPGIGERVETESPMKVRRFLMDTSKYHMYYRVKDQVLEVLAVWHSSREHGPSL